MYIIYIFIDVYAYHMHELYQYSIYISLSGKKMMQSIDLKFLGHSTTKGVIFQVEAVLFTFYIPFNLQSTPAGSPFFSIRTIYIYKTVVQSSIDIL